MSDGEDLYPFGSQTLLREQAAAKGCLRARLGIHSITVCHRLCKLTSVRRFGQEHHQRQARPHEAEGRVHDAHRVYLRSAMVVAPLRDQGRSRSLRPSTQDGRIHTYLRSKHRGKAMHGEGQSQEPRICLGEPSEALC